MAYKDKAQEVKYKNDFAVANYDRISFFVPKGEKDRIRDHAEAVDESVNAYIWQAVRERMEREKSGG